MDFRQLKYFLTVAEEGQITRAAKRLHVTQPPLSQQMILLEKELGVQLFERGKHHIRLTGAGIILRNRAEQMQEIMTTLSRELQEEAGGISGRLAIGTVSSYGRSLLPGRIRQFHRQYPRVHFHVRQGDTAKIIDLLQSGLIEIGIVRFPVAAGRYDYITLPEESMVVATTGYLPGSPGAVEWRDLRGRPLLVHQRHEPAIADFCRQAGFEPSILCVSDDITLLLIWAGLGIGHAIVPESASLLLPDSPLIYQEITNPPMKTTSAVIWLKNRPLSAAAEHFTALFR